MPSRRTIFPSGVPRLNNWSNLATTSAVISVCSMREIPCVPGHFAFFGCTGLTELDVEPANAGYSSLGGVLFDKARTTLIQYPGGKAGAYAIPAGVTRIQSAAFASHTSPC